MTEDDATTGDRSETEDDTLAGDRSGTEDDTVAGDRSGTETGAGTDEATATLDAFFESYRDAYRSLDLPAVLDHYNVPLLSMTEDDLFWLTSEAELESVMGAYLDSLRDRDYERGEIDALSYHFLSERDVIASSAWTRYAIDGTVLERLGTTYLCRRFDDEWRIVALVLHGPAHSIDAST